LGESIFSFAFTDLELVDFAGKHFPCTLKFGVDSNNQLSCTVSCGWGDLCRAYGLAEGDRVRFCITKTSNNHVMYGCVYP
jgi:hypothetical protein